jgi:hypothetical protein
MVRVFFPSMYMRLISWKPNKSPPQALLHVHPSMTKHEVTEYLTKIYNVSVSKVMTANFLGKNISSPSQNASSFFGMCLFSCRLFNLGKWKRLYAKRQVISYKRRNYKTALVYYQELKAKADTTTSS